MMMWVGVRPHSAVERLRGNVGAVNALPDEANAHCFICHWNDYQRPGNAT